MNANETTLESRPNDTEMTNYRSLKVTFFKVSVLEISSAVSYLLMF